jgi:hypothetical protein
MENDSSMFHRPSGLANARHFRQRSIAPGALPDGASRAIGKVCREALHEAERMRRLHEVKNRYAGTRMCACTERSTARGMAHTGLALTCQAPRATAFLRQTFARISSDRYFEIHLDHARRGARKCFIADNFMRHRFKHAKTHRPNCSEDITKSRTDVTIQVSE